MEDRIRKVSPTINSQFSQAVGEDISSRITDMPGIIGSFYTVGHLEYSRYNIPYYTFWALLLLTLIRLSLKVAATRLLCINDLAPAIGGNECINDFGLEI